ncbi:hypothetical protein FXF50_04705 [Micromonospora sp. AP08]|uniref:DUF6519 domain-containing protein n=1 Tax=Micromonospora sp. AP08 TaxID=2604467 RepID=UPI0011D33406|nr:DUF6519 domain-containing protein [Micromonospora sp. AP08]TYB39683.1 hypothetical protein FXF50_04705 [Micromonospora sp. AP08]
MSGDYSRWTHDARDGDTAVLLQQGRILTDADWNEQAAGIQRRVQAEALDTIGRAGVPTETPDGFKVSLNAGALSIGIGRMYVDGILAENHGAPPEGWRSTLAELVGTTAILYMEQPHLPKPPQVPSSGKVLVYLKVWRRELTAVDDPGLVEPALGVDTTTRLRTVWQVKAVQVPANYVPGAPFETLVPFLEAEPPTVARLTVGTATVDVDPSPCQIAPTGGYTGVENHLYRIEVHTPGVAGTATFKWSRDNATVAARVTSVPATMDRLVVDRLGPDEVLSLHDGEWIEILDAARELAGQPGVMRRIKSGGGIDEATRTVLLTQPLAATDFALDAQGQPVVGSNLRVRRWDQGSSLFDEAGNPVSDPALAGGTITIPAPGTRLLLEHNLTVAFSTAPTGGKLRTGDYWLVPARTADPKGHETADQPAAGIHAHYAPLALVEGSKVTDLRPVFPPFTGLDALFYVAGDGQEVTPNTLAPAPVALPVRPTVGVSRGPIPLEGRSVEFTVTGGGGTVNGGSGPVKVPTAADGTASVAWSIHASSDQTTLEARLLDAASQPTGLPVRFSARTRRAATVSYQPGACGDLGGVGTVQEALDKLCQRPSGRGPGCCATVGDGGDYGRLEEAIRDLADRHAGDVCICLLAGDHEFEHDPIEFVRRLNIHGCGARLRLRTPLEVLKADAVELSDLEIIGDEGLEEHLVRLVAVSEVRLRGLWVHLSGQEVRTLVHLIGCGSTRVDDCTMAASVEVQADASPRFTGVARSLLTAARDVDLQALKTVAENNRRTAITRRLVAAGQLEGFALSPTGLADRRLARVATAAAELIRAGASLENFEKLLPDIGELADHLEVRSGHPRAALCLEEPHGPVWVRGNMIAGGLSLYGVASPQRIDELNDRIDDILGEARDPGELNSGFSRLLVEGNSLAWVLLAGHPKELLTFGSAAFDNNRLIGGLVELAAGRVTFSANDLDSGGARLAGLVYGNKVSATTNIGPGRESFLVLSSPVRVEAANADLMVAP